MIAYMNVITGIFLKSQLLKLVILNWLKIIRTPFKVLWKKNEIRSS